MFQRLELNNWRQFDHVDIAFHRQVTILTGANGAGKTTLLHLLNRHWGWNLQFVSTPRFSSRGIRHYWAGFWSEDEPNGPGGLQAKQPPRDIGRITYQNGQSSVLTVPGNVQEVFAVDIRGQQTVFGVYVPSHRPPYVFRRVDQIPTQLDAKEQIFQTYLNELMQRFTGAHKAESPSFRIKSALISLATFGYGNEAVDRNEDAVRIFEGFERVLRTVLPQTLGFKRLRVRVPDVLLDTATGEFSFDAVSGGVAALIDISWQIFMYSLLHEQFVVVIDEPEAHLHPALQQKILPDLLKAFSSVQFIVATHNPFIVASVPDSNVYVLSYDPNNRVRSTLLDFANKAGTANDILRDVLGLSFTVPLWVNERVQAAIEEFSQEEVSEASMVRLKEQLKRLGLGHLFPETVSRALERRR